MILTAVPPPHRDLTAPLPSRRTLLAGMASALGLAVPQRASQALPVGSEARIEDTLAKKSLSVVCVGVHPDDPEESSFGTRARYGEAGHHVTVIYLTRGERGIPGQSLEEAAAIRTAEAEAACRIIGAKAVFAGQVDGDTAVNRKRIAEFSDLSSWFPHLRGS